MSGLGDGVGMSNGLLPFCTRRFESKGSQKGSRSVIGHIDLTFIVHHMETENFAPNRIVETHCRLLPSVWHACDPADVSPRSLTAASLG